MSVVLLTFKYQQINRILLLPFVVLHTSYLSPQLFSEHGIVSILLKISRIVHDLRNLLAKLVWRGGTQKTFYT